MAVYVWLRVLPTPVRPSPKVHAYASVVPSGSELAEALKLQTFEVHE